MAQTGGRSLGSGGLERGLVLLLVQPLSLLLVKWLCILVLLVLQLLGLLGQ